ncbi:MAG: OmpA family protein [Saprospiraceae bacterium]|nr:OmpA family protein [Saprospiraceae bacterium]
MKKTIALSLLCFLLGAIIAQQSTLKAEYFNGTNFEEKVTSRTESNIDKAWNDVPPVPGIDPHNCSIRWTGRITAPESGTYTFSARVDDGIRVWVGGVQVIDNWRLNDNGQSTGQVKMKAGTSYDLRVEYFNALIEGEVTLIWKLPNSNKPEVVAPEFFTQKPKPAVAPAQAVQQPVAEAKPKPTKPVEKPKAKPPVVQPEPTKPGKPVELPKDTLEKYVPKNVLFVQGKAIMLDASKPDLDKLAGFMLRNPSYKIKVEGHTDIIGDTDMNQALSDERAKVVAEYLAQRGVGEERLQSRGYGSSRPLYKGNSKKGYAQNRRVAFVIYY